MMSHTPNYFKIQIGHLSVFLLGSFMNEIMKNALLSVHICQHAVHLHPAEKNGLSFLETSALDSTNVETAFQTILTGWCPYPPAPPCLVQHFPTCSTLINSYRGIDWQLSSRRVLQSDTPVYWVRSQSGQLNRPNYLDYFLLHKDSVIIQE